MSSTELMGWNSKQKRWFARLPKQYGGTIKAVGHRTLSLTYPTLVKDGTKEGTRSAANQWWRDNLAKLAQEVHADIRPHADYWRNQLETHKARRGWYQSQGDEKGVQEESTTIEEIEATLKQKELPEPSMSFIPGSLGYPNVMNAIWRDRLARRSKPSTTYSILNLAERFVAACRLDITAKGRNPDRPITIQGELRHFSNWVENDDIREVKGITLVDFKAHLLKRVEDGEISLSRARDIMATTRRFVIWCSDTAEVIDAPPKNVRSRELTIEVPPQAIETFSDKHVKLLLSKANEREKLWLLLILNTGMTPKEISSMSNLDRKHENDHDYNHVPRLDWNEGRITRKRSKTKRFVNVPVVETKLWGRTMKLLRKFGRKNENPVLVNEDGGPLVQQTQKTDTKHKRGDCIGRSFRRLRVKVNKTLKKDKITRDLKAFRKTSASKFDNDSEFSRYVVHFLGHSPRGVAARFYVEPSREQFDRAIEWLDKQFVED